MRKKWSLETVSKEALKYKTKKEFSIKSSGAYNWASTNKVMDKVTHHMPKNAYGGKYKWTEENIRSVAQRFTKRGEFRKAHSGAAFAADRLGIYEDICSHMEESLTAQYSIEELKREALKYKHRKEFQIGHPSAYQTALKRKILDQVCSHMPKNLSVIRGPDRWTLEAVKREALKYSSKGDFIRYSRKAYDAASTHNFLSEVCSHMTSGNRDPYTESEIIEIAKRYPDKTQFSSKARGAYKAAIRLNILDKVCDHMPKKGVVSSSEIDILKIIREAYPKAHTLRDHKIKWANKPYIKGFQIDIYIPELRKGIEFDGTYWHSVVGLKRSRKDWPEEDLKNYHHLKDEYFKSKGIEIMHIKEENWLKNREECLKKILEFVKQENNNE